MKVLFISIANLLLIVSLNAQSLSGKFPRLIGQQVKLSGFSGFRSYAIDSVKVSNNASFTLSFSESDYGTGILITEDSKPFIVLLTGDDINITGESFDSPDGIEILESEENKLFGQYASEHPRREQVLSAWNYLERIYEQDSLFKVHNVPLQAIIKEIQRLETQDKLFLKGLKRDTYLSWYLSLRRLVSSVSTIAQYRTEEIPATIKAFRKMDYTDKRLYKSGLLEETIESHFWLIENSGRSLDSVYIEMNKSIDILIRNLLADEQKLNEITEYLFKLLEKRSLFKASEYLALRLLNEQACTINNDLTSQLESYRAMKKGNTAPDIVFTGDVLAPGYENGNKPRKLSDIKSKYFVVVFGSAWCPRCPQELMDISGLYEKWKKHGVNVVFVSLDDDTKKFKSFGSVFPFISTCDYQKWESPAVKSYYVFATPTVYLLDHSRKILLRPNSVNQLDSWVDWYLVQGNK